jgi:hypothetical protein
MRSEPPIPYTALLTCHPTTNNPAVQKIAVHVAWSQDDTLVLSYALTGDCTRLKIPEERPQARVDGLWQQTCFEAFLAPKDGPTYWECNFSPSREWAAYQFRGYRERADDGEMIAPPQIIVHQAADRFTLDTRLHLPHLLAREPLRLGLSAVIEDDLGKLSYWALQHPAEKPDFHHADAFILEIWPMMTATTGKEPQ